MSNCKRWTCEEDTRLLSLHKAQNSSGWIARALNRSEGAIKSRLAKHFFHIEHGKKCGSSTVARKDLPDDYKEMMQTELHHDHRIVMVNDVIRWEENEGVREVVDICDLNHMIADMQVKGIGKNDEAYRRLYRNIRYSLDGYWEIFYWSMNNDEAGEYRPPIEEKS